MTGEGLQHYERHDVTASTDPRVSGNRSITPAATLVHTSSGDHSRSWLQGGSADAGTPASSNALIDRDGTQWQITPDSRYPYHAGWSSYRATRSYTGDEVSQLFIGIEVECRDDQYPTWQQYDSLADLQIYYAIKYNWRWPLITLGHYAVAIPLGRRSDPVHFDWGAWLGRLYVRAKATNLPGLEG